jgi:hypothetical protein
MTPNDHLFQLIQSLTASEKRYFKLFAAKQGSGDKATNYEKLFDTYNELPGDEPYNEEKLLLKLKQQKIGKYLSDEKKYLTELIMKAMRLYAGEKKAEGQLAEMLQEVNFLMEKGLYEQCIKVADRAWAIAEERDLTEYKLRLLQIYRLIDKEDYNTRREAHQQKIRKREEIALAQLAAEREAAYLREMLYHIYVTHHMAQRAAEVNQIYQALNTLQKKDYLTFDCVHTIISAKCIILDYEKRYTEGINQLKYLIAEWEKSPWRREEMPERYVKLLGNFHVFVFRAESYAEIPLLIKRLERINTQEKEVLKDIFFLTITCKLFNYTQASRFNQALQLVPVIKEGLKKYGALLNFVQQRVLKSNVCFIYLKNKKYPEVLDAVQDAYALVGRNRDKQKRMEDIRIFEFIAHYELGNIEVLYYNIRNNRRYFKEHQPDNGFIEDVWKLLGQFIENSANPKQAKRNLKSQINQLDCPAGNIALKQELLNWLQG